VLILKLYAEELLPFSFFLAAAANDADSLFSQEGLDPVFAASNDVWYRMRAAKKGGTTSRILDRTLVQHALPATNLSTFKTFLDPTELVQFHRPRLAVPQGHVVHVMPVADQSVVKSAAHKDNAAAAGEPDRSRYRLGVAGNNPLVEALFVAL
jgi:hypothetical protein